MSYNDLRHQSETTDKINQLIATANKSMECGSACQELKERKNLDKIYQKAQNNVQNAPEELEIAEKNYYQFTLGEGGYKNMLRERYKKNAIEMQKKLTSKHDDNMTELNNLFKEVEDQSIYSARMSDLMQKYLIENKTLKNKTDLYLKQTHTSDRKTYYENEQLTTLQKWDKIMFIIYWILFTACALILLVVKKQYKNKKIIGILTLFIIFPFTVVFLYKKGKNFINMIVNLFGYKNVYKTL